MFLFCSNNAHYPCFSQLVQPLKNNRITVLEALLVNALMGGWVEDMKDDRSVEKNLRKTRDRRIFDGKMRESNVRVSNRDRLPTMPPVRQRTDALNKRAPRTELGAPEAQAAHGPSVSRRETTTTGTRIPRLRLKNLLGLSVFRL